ncbi:hypothetical protein BC937DRAFT_86979 [Endogone sp. FLAS-F59071]|nr:hypothetical protein BC937DRAFT_86979 [Endogone sp. FLAS-F59071]RUS23345.1 hypothetical protein BC937DRAFT_86979 [Endogone sp. FLAS-F59071]|eukprot:RUS23344.1 hypothetical protein BC937DRAFT_86979 [Endogone sp. FLAS-F59071]
MHAHVETRSPQYQNKSITKRREKTENQLKLRKPTMTDNTALPQNIANETVSKPVSEEPTTIQNLPLNSLAPQPPSAVSLDDAPSVKNSATATHSVNGKAEEPAKSKDEGPEKGIGINARPPEATDEWPVGGENGEFGIEGDTTARTTVGNSGTAVDAAETPVQLGVVAQVQIASQDPPQFMETPLKKRRGRPPGSGRKRKLAEVDTEPADDQEWKPLKDETEGGTSEHDHDGEEDDEAKTTKFGRKVQKPTQYNPILLTPGNPATKRPYHRRGPISPSGGIICTVCHRGHSPKNNRIVLCDNCDRPYHQQCHNPIVEDLIVSLPDAKWYCAQCERGRKKKKVETEITGVGIGLDQKKAYLLSLPKSSLVDLVLFAEKYRPDLKLYPAYLKADPEIATAAITVASTVPDAVDNTTLFDIPLFNQPFLRTPLIKHTSDGGDEYAEGETIGSPSEVPSSRDFEQLEAEGVPSYEDMIAKALTFIADPKGTQPKEIWEWMSKSYPLAENFSRSASQSLLKAVKKGRFMKEDGLYKLNPAYVPDPAKSRRGARKPSFVKSDGTIITPSKKPISSPRKKSKESAADDGSRRNGNTEADAENKGVRMVAEEIPESGIELDFREGASSQVHHQQLRPIVAATMESPSIIPVHTVITTTADEDDSDVVSIPAAASLPSMASDTFPQSAISHSLNGTPAATAPHGPVSHVSSFQASQHFPVPGPYDSGTWPGNFHN